MISVLLLSVTAGHVMWVFDHSVRACLGIAGKAAHRFDTFFEAVLPSPARPGLTGVPTPRSHL